MALLFEKLSIKTAEWRKQGFPHEEFSPIAEIFEWASSPDGSGFQLRSPQLRALEVYWFLRLVENTPRLFDLYQKFFSPDDDPEGLLKALGISYEAFTVSKFKFPNLWKNIRTNDEFVREHSLEALRETIELQYPSYILALAMGSGKTALIGAIIATEFGMALEYPDGPFIQNALVFAPGTTILGSLRELAAIPYERILPPRLFKQFAATVKLIFTRDGEKDISVIKGSSFNIVVTNTEKIRIQKETIRKIDIGTLFSSKKEDEARSEIANLRLQSISSLPHLGVFSDEAHHTYGQALDTELKKVRKTVNYLQDNSPNLVCVVNTTGTPYFKKQPLRDVVVWYGLSQGIMDNILKPVADNIHAYDFQGNAKKFVAEVISDFFSKYRDIRLPDGSWSKLAIYFPQTNDLRELRPAAEAKLIELGLPTDLLFERHSDSTKAEKDAFERINEVNAHHRVILLVNMGTEGWNVPSLFACALARKLKTSNNFVLQAASRCLRQVPGNIHPASIYLSSDNRRTLEKELQETYGESLEDLRQKESKSRTAQIYLRKIALTPLVVRQLVRTVIRRERENGKLQLTTPAAEEQSALTRTSFEIARQSATRALLKQAGDAVVIKTEPDYLDLYTAAAELAAVYRLNEWTVLDELRRVYLDENELPISHLRELGKQIEDQICQYEVKEEYVERALALIKPQGFDRGMDTEGNEIYTADIRYPIDREKLLAHYESWKEKYGSKSAPFGFHYTPYNFDSNPELSFFEQLFEHLGLHPDQVEDIFFTGAITDPRKTDFFVEYRGEDNRWHRYTPDFLIRRKPDEGKKHGRCLIIEIKAERERSHPIDGQKGAKALAVRQWERLNYQQLKYEMIFVKEDVLARDQTQTARNFVEE